MNSRTKSISLIAAREVRERTRSRAFRLSTFLLLMVVAAAVVFPAIAERTTSKATYAVGLVQPVDQNLTKAISDLGVGLGTEVQTIAFQNEPSATEALRSGIVNVLLLPGKSVETRIQPDPGTPTDTSNLAAAVAQVEQRFRGLASVGVDSNQAASALNVASLPLKGLQAAPPRNASDAQASTSGMVLLFVFLTLYGAFILNGVIEEKTSRVVEILLSTVRPAELLAGKVIGIGLVGTLQGVVLVIATIVARAATPGGAATNALTPAVVLYSLLWFLLGFAVYAGLYACAGALVSRAEDAQNLVFPLQLPLVGSYVVGLTGAVNGPNPVLNAFSYFPLTAPMTMLERMAAGQVEWWQVLISVALAILAAILIMRVAVMIFAGGILRSGQRVKLRDAWRTN